MNVSIIGSGAMGCGIAQVLIVSTEVKKLTVITRGDEQSEKVKEACSKHLFRLLKKGRLTEEQIAVSTSKLNVSNDYAELLDAELIIEAVAENFEIKNAIYKKIKPYVSSNTIVASNTSSLSITAFSSLFDNPENVVGLHFFNPAPVMELVEVVIGHVTSQKTMDSMILFTKAIGKSPVVVNEAPGFVVNRMLIPMINEAVSILAEGIASAKDIDNAMKFGAHHPMGPLALADLIGNDVNLSIMETLYAETGDPKYRAHPLLRKMVRANHLGRKTKQGFYEY